MIWFYNCKCARQKILPTGPYWQTFVYFTMYFKTNNFDTHLQVCADCQEVQDVFITQKRNNDSTASLVPHPVKEITAVTWVSLWEMGQDGWLSCRSVNERWGRDVTGSIRCISFFKQSSTVWRWKDIFMIYEQEVHIVQLIISIQVK